MSLEKFIARQKQLNKNVQLNENRSARRFRYFDADLDGPNYDGSTVGLHEEEPEVDAYEAPADGGAENPAQDFSQGGGEEAPAPEATPAEEPGMEGGDPSAVAPGEDPNVGAEPVDGGQDIAPDPAAEADTEIDVTELVNQIQATSAKSDDIINKLVQNIQSIQSVSQSVNALQGSLGNMQQAIQALSHQVELMRPPTEDERRKVVQQNSYPYNQDVNQALDGPKQTQTDLEKKSDKLSMQNILSTFNAQQIKDTF